MRADQSGEGEHVVGVGSALESPELQDLGRAGRTQLMTRHAFDLAVTACGELTGEPGFVEGMEYFENRGRASGDALE